MEVFFVARLAQNLVDLKYHIFKIGVLDREKKQGHQIIMSPVAGTDKDLFLFCLYKFPRVVFRCFCSSKRHGTDPISVSSEKYMHHLNKIEVIR